MISTALHFPIVLSLICLSLNVKSVHYYCLFTYFYHTEEPTVDVQLQQEPKESSNPFGDDLDEEDENPFKDPTPPDRFLSTDTPSSKKKHRAPAPPREPVSKEKSLSPGPSESLLSAKSPGNLGHPREKSPTPKKKAPEPPRTIDRALKEIVSMTKKSKSPTSPERPVYEGTPPSTPKAERKRPLTPPLQNDISESQSSPNTRYILNLHIITLASF